MKTIAASWFALALSLQCGFGQSDTNNLAVGEWSAPVEHSIWTLRGRLLVSPPLEGSNMVRVYVELQHVLNPTGRVLQPAEILINQFLPVRAEMHDSEGKVSLGDPGWITDGPLPKSYTLALAEDSTIRLLASNTMAFRDRDKLVIAVPGRAWVIARGTTNEYYLSATFDTSLKSGFRSPKNPPSADSNSRWQGKLLLPKVRIPTKG